MRIEVFMNYISNFKDMLARENTRKNKFRNRGEHPNENSLILNDLLSIFIVGLFVKLILRRLELDQNVRIHKNFMISLSEDNTLSLLSPYHIIVLLHLIKIFRPNL